MKTKKAIIVGGGIGGIATAIRMSVMGYEVDLFEKNDVAGGKMYLIEKDGYSFDAGPSLFTQPANIEALFAFAGEPMEDYFTYSPVDIACQYFFENGIRVNAYTKPESFANEMQNKTGEDPNNIIRYLKNAERVYDKVGNISFYDSQGRDSFTKPYSDDTARIIDEEVSHLIESQYQRALQILTENKDKLTALAEKLLTSEVIFKEDLEQIFGKRQWIAEDQVPVHIEEKK